MHLKFQNKKIRPCTFDPASRMGHAVLLSFDTQNDRVESREKAVFFTHKAEQLLVSSFREFFQNGMPLS